MPTTPRPRPSLLCALLLLLPACGREPSADGHAGAAGSFESAPGRAAQPATQPANKPVADAPAHPDPIEGPPGVREDGSVVFAVDWFAGSVEQALAAARTDDRLVFVDVGAYWCPPCHELDEKTFTDPAVGAWLREHAVAVHIDAEKGEGPELVDRYQIQAYPTLLVLEASGIEKARLVDFIAADALLTQLEAIAAGGNVLAALEAEAAAATDTGSADKALEANYRLAHAYVLAAKREQAEALFERLLTDDPDNQAGVAAKVLYDRAMFLTMKVDADPARAITELQELQRRFPASPQAVSAYRMIGRAHCRLGQPDQAVAALEAMVAGDPEDVARKASFGWFAFRQRCRPDAGLAAVLAGIAQAPDDAELRYLEAELRAQLDQPAEALAAMRQASALEPDNAYYKRSVRRFEAAASPL